MTNLNVS